MPATYRVVQNGANGDAATRGRAGTPGVWLSTGIFPAAYVFSWATLQKRYGQKVRITSFAWLLACMAIAMPGRSPGNQPLQASAASQVAATAEQGTVAPSSQWAAVSQPAEVESAVRECISVAQQFGYRNGQCAHEFIEACLTGSPSRVKQEYEVDRMTGMVAASSCSNMPANYRATFNRF